MKNYITNLENLIDKAWLEKHIRALYRLEKLQTFPAYQASADYVYKLLKDEGLEAEIVHCPADGKTVYQDVRMPLGWNVENMTLTLLTPIDGIKDGVLADYRKNPCSAVKHSVATPQNGIDALVVCEDDIDSKESLEGTFVLLNQDTRPRSGIISKILDKGAIGFLSDYCENPGEAPDHTAWLNAGTETDSWHVQSGDRDFICYMLTPRKGEALRKACQNDEVMVHAFSDACRYETTLPFVSALLPGASKKEIWIMAHMYEPLIDDNPNGVIGSIAIAKAIRKMAENKKINLKHSIRLVFASEVYGFCAAAEYYGGNLSERTIGGINMDGLPASKEKGKHRNWRVFQSPDLPGYGGNIFLHEIMDAACKLHSEYSFELKNSSYGDDQQLSDSTVGLSTVWFLRGDYNCFHHNSILTEEYLDIDVFADTLTLSGAWVCAMTDTDDEKLKSILPSAVKRAQQKIDERINSHNRMGTNPDDAIAFVYNREKNRILNLLPWASELDLGEYAGMLTLPVSAGCVHATDDANYKKSAGYVFKRLTRGLPMDMTRIPEKEKASYRGLFIYYPIAELFSRMDGKKTFQDVINEYEWDKNTTISDAKIGEYLDICLTYSDHGYLEIVK